MAKSQTEAQKHFGEAAKAHGTEAEQSGGKAPKKPQTTEANTHKAGGPDKQKPAK